MEQNYCHLSLIRRDKQARVRRAQLPTWPLTADSRVQAQVTAREVFVK